MKTTGIGLALALATASFALPAAAQDMHQGTMDHHMDNPAMQHDNMDRRDMRGDGRHHGWNRGHGHHRKCWWTWRHHHRVKTCAWR